ncbi:MAG: hypothetical protein KA790_10865 [Ottowia sp.]|nr:hypothetical protein [Ottowia sp.]
MNAENAKTLQKAQNKRVEILYELSQVLDYQEVSDDERTASAVWERACPRSSVGGDEAPHRGQARSHNTV